MSDLPPIENSLWNFLQVQVAQIQKCLVIIGNTNVVVNVDVVFVRHDAKVSELQIGKHTTES